MEDRPMSEDYYQSPDDDDLTPETTLEDAYWHYMNRAAENFMWFCRMMGLMVLVLYMWPVHATDLDGQWSNSPNAEWYKKQVPTPETLRIYELEWGSCCDIGDACQPCVVHRYNNKPPWREGFYYVKDGITHSLPPHIVDYVPWTPTGKPVLFLAPYDSGKVKKGEPVCLKVPGGSS